MTEPTFTQWARRVEEMLERTLPKARSAQATLHDAMRYACLGGGKRIRALLVYAGGDMLGVDPRTLDYPAAAIEMVHAYSLIHDDLPAMDDDDLRRGKPSCHRAFGEAVAILAGDTLQAQAFELLCRPESGLDAAARLSMVHLLADAMGARGMAGGQLADVEAVGRTLDLAQLEAIHGMKTGALIRASVMLGAGCGRPDAHVAARLEAYGERLGLAFQVVDDILDETTDGSGPGKPGGADRIAGKPTYTSILGLEKAAEAARRLHAEALASLDAIRYDTDTLRRLADFMINRRH